MATLAYYRRPVSGVPTPRVEYVNPETRIGDELLVPGIHKDLEDYYNKTNSDSDKAKALELLTSLQLGQEILPQRPATAFPAYDTEIQNDKYEYEGRKDSCYTMDPYQTTYGRDYPAKEPSDTIAYRPQSSQGFSASHPLDGPIGETHYTNHFNEKPNRPATPIRSGTASGSRSNKPHPLQSFLIWRFPAKAKQEQESSPWSEELTDEMIGQVHKRLCQSTYQSDFLGIPQGFQVKNAYNLPPDWKANIPYTLDSVARYSYQKPNQQQELSVPTSRYGSNKKKPIAASGTIPTASTRYMHIKGRTTYDRHYNDNAGNVVSQIREIGHKLGQEALQKYYEKAEGQEKETIGRILNAYKGGDQDLPPRPNSRMSQRSEIPPVSTPSSFASRNRPRTPSTARLDTKPPVHPLHAPKHVAVNRPRGKYPDLRTSKTPPATPVSLKYTSGSPKGSKTPCTPVSDFEISVPMQAPQPPGTPQSLPLNFSPGYNLS